MRAWLAHASSATHAPLLGQHTRRVLMDDAGLSEEAVDAMLRTGVARVVSTRRPEYRPSHTALATLAA